MSLRPRQRQPLRPRRRNMDLRENRISVGELLMNTSAKTLLKKEFPEVMSPLMLAMAKKMTLQSVLELAGSRYPQEKLQRVLEELRAI